MLNGGKPNPYLDKKNLEKRTITPRTAQRLIGVLEVSERGLQA